MKNLDLNAYGVYKLNQREMIETDGGLLFGLLLGLVIGIVVAELLDRNAAADFNEGWEAGKNSGYGGNNQ